MSEYKATVKTANAQLDLTGIEAENDGEAETQARWEALENHLEDGVEIESIEVEEV